jgi:hypothetical protein
MILLYLFVVFFLGVVVGGFTQQWMDHNWFLEQIDEITNIIETIPTDEDASE